MLNDKIWEIGHKNNLSMEEKYSMFLSNIEKATFKDFEELLISEIKYRQFKGWLDELEVEWRRAFE